MPQVIFADPLGTPFINVSFEEISNLLDTKGEEYWNCKKGSGSAQLYYCEDENQKNISTEIALNITMKDNIGVYICHYGKDRRSHSACWGNLDMGTIVRIFDAHEGIRLFPRSLFVPSTDAKEAISYFFENGGRSPNVQWLWSGSIPWHELESETDKVRKGYKSPEVTLY